MGPATICGTNRHHVSLGWVRHDEALTKMAAACWARDRFTDVVIFCEDRVLHAHRLVLASMSPLLANLLAEAEGPDTALLLPEVKAEDMRLLLQFIYQGEVVLPPRRTAALLDLAAQLCVAGVRGGATPPSPPRSDSPELDSSDRNESDQVSEDEQHPDESRQKSNQISDRVEVTNICPAPANDNISQTENSKDDSTDESNDRPMNLAAKPEAKANENVNCSRPKPCNSSPPDFNAFSNHSISTPLVTRLSEPRTSTASYYQHPALRGCHPFSLELAISHNRNLSSCRTADASPYTRPNHSRKSPSETNSDVEMTSTADDRDREIDLSLKPDSNHTRSSSNLDEDKISPSPEHDNSFESSESVEPHPGRDEYSHQANGGSSGVTDMRMNLADKMLLLPAIGSGTGMSADPRRTYLEAVLQESLVQQSYTIVLPSHLGVTNALTSSERAGAPTVHSNSTLENKTWNLSGKHSAAAAAVAELQCLQGFFNSHGGLSISSNNEPNFSRNSAGLRCDEDDEDDEDEDEDMMPTNLSTSKNGNYGSPNSMNSKRNGKEGYSCQVCRKMFTSSSNLAVHSMIHSGTKPFKCDLCSWSFRQKAHLQKHMRHIHKIIVAK
ncbi:transcription factor Ken-like [Daphnia pulicaria]|nr:transcription factor Ken-like [Daphnia pulicaria]XP_046640701.1 transcription factor Ken-like [Daphnia pulicaria]XP_046640702.1 transcription factor Ken-like [Daphnia pulicaria]